MMEEDRALKEYAKEKRVEGICWTDEDGGRCVWGPGKCPHLISRNT
jgi:hypothetical protein